MEKITIRQFLSFTNVYVPVYIEDEFMRYDSIFKDSMIELVMTEEQWNCPIDYIRNVDGGHFGDDEKKSNSIVLGIGIENWEKYFGKE
jgi:hypothetical protein